MINFKTLAAGEFVDNYGDDWAARFMGDGLPTALLGIATVFAVLAIIWGFLEIFRYVFYTVPERNKHGEKLASAPKAKPAPVQAAPARASVQSTNDAEVVAAIVAAITAMRAEENVADPSAFRVVSFRKR